MKTPAHRLVPVSIAVLAFAAWMVFSAKAFESNFTARRATGEPQLMSVQPLSTAYGEMCEWVPVSFTTQGRPAPVSRPASTLANTTDADRNPIRVIRDNYPTYSAIAVDTNSNEVYLQDENLFGIKVFNRTDNTPPRAALTEPKRIIGGPLTKLEFNCALYVDPKNGDVYSVNNDTLDTMTVFPRDAKGNVKAMRSLHTPHRAYGIAIDEQAQELFLTIEHPPQIVVYRKSADGDEKPIRSLQGEHTRLADPHGIAVDTKNGWMFVSNHGASSGQWKQGGWFDPPSITIYPVKANGNTAPLRTISGPKTRLNWPAHVFLDSEHGELFVANDVDDSILVFHTTDNGDVAPTRVLKGARTGLKNPTSLFVDTKNNELFVSNMGNHTATVYPRAASGDTAPLRTIRSAPLGMPAQMIGNPGAVGYDSKREEILVPN
jgi:6-phosphogluconolactonase (cycloisomerase 2 family)